MKEIDWTPAKYKEENGIILKDGHKMFIDDVVKDLNRRSFLELENFRLQNKLIESAEKINKITEELGEYLELKED